ncbi:hypothetical protein [Capnocytophaga canimorsus]|uniref:hypothetical protein n=1 Tax=Capnocytophaga canimorsus TaxID=28188 RepID=UPI0028EFD8F4|nr:hypothetical protein [Capnocytophaga canimorsus]MDT9500403.1 hypothetical protein [Capnocytophaga canimorsus]
MNTNNNTPTNKKNKKKKEKKGIIFMIVLLLLLFFWMIKDKFKKKDELTPITPQEFKEVVVYVYNTDGFASLIETSYEFSDPDDFKYDFYDFPVLKYSDFYSSDAGFKSDDLSCILSYNYFFNPFLGEDSKYLDFISLSSRHFKSFFESFKVKFVYTDSSSSQYSFDFSEYPFLFSTSDQFVLKNGLNGKKIDSNKGDILHSMNFACFLCKIYGNTVYFYNFYVPFMFPNKAHVYPIFKFVFKNDRFASKFFELFSLITRTYLDGYKDNLLYDALKDFKI